MKKWMFAMFGAVLVLGACGDNADNDPAPADNGNNNNAETTNNAADNGDYDLARGEELYQGNCASCHGGDAEGASGPGIAGLSQDDVLAAIEEGPGSMPEDLVTGDEAEDVAAWVADQ